MYPAVCGIAIPFYRVIEVPQSQTSLAGTLGYQAPGQFPALLVTPCPNQEPQTVPSKMVILPSGLIEGSYIVTFKPFMAMQPSPVWPPITDPALKAAMPIPRFAEHGTGQSKTELAAVPGIKGRVIGILDSMNAAAIEMDAQEAEKLKADPRVLRIDQNRVASAGATG